MCVLSIKVPIQKKSRSLLKAPYIYIYIFFFHLIVGTAILFKVPEIQCWRDFFDK